MNKVNKLMHLVLLLGFCKPKDQVIIDNAKILKKKYFTRCHYLKFLILTENLDMIKDEQQNVH